MGRKENYLRVLRHGSAEGEIPLWELHFHLFDKLNGGGFVAGPAFMALSAQERSAALWKDAEIMASWGEALGFSAVSIPDAPWDCIYTLPQESRLELVRNLKSLDPDFAVVAGSSGVISMPSSGAEFQEFCFQMFDAPEEIDEQCRVIYRNFEAQAKELADAGIDAIYMAADIADTRAPFFDRDQMQRWYLPYLRQSSEYLHGLGLPAILHTDGNVESLLKDFRDAGIDALQAIDPIAGMRMDTAQAILESQVTVCGNLDCSLMLAGTPEQVYASAKEILQASKGKPGFVFGNSNAVAVETPLENYRAMLEAWKTFGKIERKGSLADANVGYAH